jgi:hypothetical protein
MVTFGLAVSISMALSTTADVLPALSIVAAYTVYSPSFVSADPLPPKTHPAGMSSKLAGGVG